MSITLATIGAGIMTGISHPITTFGLLTANTVMNGIELHNDQEMKGSLSRIENKQDKIVEGIESLQESTSYTVTYSQMKKLLSEPVPAPTVPTTPATPAPATLVATPAPAPVPDNNPPAWAQQIIKQQEQQAEIIKNLMQPASPANTTVNVGAAPAPVATPAPTTPATTTPAATTPAPAAPADESALDAKLDKLIEGFAAFVDSFKQQANAEGAPADTGSSDTKTG